MDKIVKYHGSLDAIVAHLESCNFESESGPLRLNAAFIALKEMTVKAAKVGSVTQHTEGKICPHFSYEREPTNEEETHFRTLPWCGCEGRLSPIC